MNGVFDTNSDKEYAEIKSNPAEDGIETVRCDNGNCKYNDIERNRCLFETCILNQFPLSIPYHPVFTGRCKICEDKIEYYFDDNTTHPFADFTTVCDKCISKIRKLIKDE